MSGVVIDLESERLIRSYEVISKEIIEYINAKDLSWEIEIARNIYFGKYINLFNSENINLSYKPFIQWLIFSYKIHNGFPLIDCVYDNCLKKISKCELDALISLKSTYESLYKVYSVERDRVFVKDVFSNKMIYIWDSLLAQNAKRYWGIYTRITCINNRNIAIPGYSIMTNSVLKDTEQYILHKFMEYKRFDLYDSIQNFINSNSLMMHRYFLNFGV